MLLDVTLRVPDPDPVSEAAGAPVSSAVAARASVCPYLLAHQAGWRSTHASRAHRCTAVAPPVVLALAKQRSLCLGPGHRRCATYVAAKAPDEALEPRQDEVLWPAVSTTPVVLEPVRGGPLPLAASPRAGAQAILVGLMVLALAVLVVARFVAPPIEGPASSPNATLPGVVPGVSPSPAPAATGNRTAAPTVAPTPSSVPTSTPSAPPASTPTPRPSIATTTYRVVSGDTLSSIAAQFNTSVATLAELNGITNPSRIRIGQVLLVPAP